jgi:chemotaxis protein MotB
MLDLVTLALMIFVLVTYFQMSFNVEELEAIDIQEKQIQFLNLLEKNFKYELSKNIISYERKLNFILLRFSNQILFCSSQYNIQSKGKKLLNKVAKLLVNTKKSQYKQIQVEGHTDNSPVTSRRDYPRNNWELSSARAIAMMKFLTQHSGLNPKIFSVNGYGEYRPVASNMTAEGKALNRRIEILIFWQSPGEES